jgi:hypothetical protein
MKSACVKPIFRENGRQRLGDDPFVVHNVDARAKTLVGIRLLHQPTPKTEEIRQQI